MSASLNINIHIPPPPKNLVFLEDDSKVIHVIKTYLTQSLSSRNLRCRIIWSNFIRSAGLCLHKFALVYTTMLHHINQETQALPKQTTATWNTRGINELLFIWKWRNRNWYLPEQACRISCLLGHGEECLGYRLKLFLWSLSGLPLWCIQTLQNINIF